MGNLSTVRMHNIFCRCDCNYEASLANLSHGVTRGTFTYYRKAEYCYRYACGHGDTPECRLFLVPSYLFSEYHAVLQLVVLVLLMRERTTFLFEYAGCTTSLVMTSRSIWNAAYFLDSIMNSL
jgi:hypothetical protein